MKKCDNSKYLAHLANQGVNALHRELFFDGADELTDEDKAVVLKAIAEYLNNKAQALITDTINPSNYASVEIVKEADND